LGDRNIFTIGYYEFSEQRYGWRFVTGVTLRWNVESGWLWQQGVAQHCFYPPC